MSRSSRKTPGIAEPMRRRSTFTRGEGNPRFAGGRWVTDTGYVRVSVGRKTNCMPYEHRTVIERLMLEQAILAASAEAIADLPKYLKVLPHALSKAVQCAIKPILMDPPEIPPGIQIHHQNYDRSDNRPENLLLLDSAIHSAITHAHRKFVRAWEREQMMARLRGDIPIQSAVETEN